MTAQDASNHRPERLQRAPRGPRASPTSPAEKPRTGQGSSRTVQSGARTAQDGLRSPRTAREVSTRAPREPQDTPMGVSQEAQDGLRAHPHGIGNHGGEGLRGADARSDEGGRVHAILGPARYPSSQGPSSSTWRRKKKSPSDFKMAQEAPSKAFGQFLVEE